MRFFLNLLWIFALAVATGYGQSEEKPYQLPDSIIITADRFPSPINNIIWPSRALNASEVNEKLTVGDALDGVAGIDLTGYGDIGHLASLMIWGTPSSQILLLYNGRPVYNYATGGFNLSEYNSDELARIEIVKGTQSSFYGSDAIGGVVNLIPRIDFLNKISGSMTYGSLGIFGYNLSLARQLNTLYRKTLYDISHLSLARQLNTLHVSANYDRLGVNNSRPNSGVTRNCLSLKSVYLPRNKDIRAEMFYRYFQDSLGLPGAVPDRANIPYYGNPESQSLVNHQRDYNHSFDLSMKFGEGEISSSPPLSGEIDLFYDRKKLSYFGRSAYLMQIDSVDNIDQSHIVGKNLGLSGRLRRQFEKVDLSGGLEYLNGSAAYDLENWLYMTNRETRIGNSDFTRSYRKHFRDSYAGWSQAQYSPIQSLAFDLSGRLELMDGNHWYESYNAGLRTMVTKNIFAKLAYGVAYRFPSFNDLYWPVDFYSAGNPNLMPEKGHNLVFTAGTSINKSMTISADLFYRNVKNLIAWAPFGVPNAYGEARWTPTNVNSFKSQGIDIEIGYSPANQWHLEGDLTYQSAKQENLELIMQGIDIGAKVFERRERAAAFVPNMKYRLGVMGTIEGFNCSADLVFTSKRRNYYSVYTFDQSGNTHISCQEKDLSSSYLTDFKVDKKLFRNASISLSINDIFDARPIRQFGSLYDGGYPGNGRTISSQIFFDIY